MITLTKHIDVIPEGWFFEGTEPVWDVLLNDPDIFLLTDGEGSYGLVEVFGDQLAECHIYVDPPRRKSDGKRIASEMLDWIDTNTPIIALMTKTPSELENIKRFVSALGFVYQEENEVQGHPYSYFMRWKHAGE